MPFSYSIDQSIPCVFVKLTGHLTADEMLQGFRRMWSDPAHSGSYSRLIDASEVLTLQATAESVRMGAEEWCDRLVGKSALLASADAHFGLFRMYQIISADDSLCEVFRNRDEALAWLGIRR